MKTQRQQNRSGLSDRGFTLIEVLIAIAIFAVGIMAVAKMQYWNARNTTTGNITTQATQLARAQIEEFKNTSDVATLTDGADPNNPIDVDGNPGGIFTRSWVVDDPLGPGSSSRRIQVTVSWTRHGQNRSVVLTSITRGNGT